MSFSKDVEGDVFVVASLRPVLPTTVAEQGHCEIGPRYHIPRVQNHRVQRLRGGFVHQKYGWGRERAWVRFNDDEQSADEITVFSKVV